MSELVGILEEVTGGGYNTEKKVNAPRLTSGMTPIKFTEPTDSAKGNVVETTTIETINGTTGNCLMKKRMLLFIQYLMKRYLMSNKLPF